MNNFIQLCAFRMRCHYERLTGPENIQNVAVVQLAAGAFCLLLEVSDNPSDNIDRIA